MDNSIFTYTHGMCLACGNFADVSGYNAFASFALAISPFFGLAVMRFFRFTSITRMMQLRSFALPVGLLLAGYNSLIIAATALLLYAFFAITWLRWPVMIITAVGLVWIWQRLSKKIRQYRSVIPQLHVYLMAAIGSLPFFIAMALFSWQIQDHIQWAYLPYYYKPAMIVFLYQFGIFFQLLLACMQVIALQWLLLRPRHHMIRHN